MTAATFSYRYDFGLRAIEHLEGAGEPQQWRLFDPDAEDEEYDGEQEAGGGEEGAGASDADDAAGRGAAAAAGEDDGPVPRVTLRVAGCLPVGSSGTQACAIRIAQELAARAVTAARNHRVTAV